jgi:uncharacterized protein YegL
MVRCLLTSLLAALALVHVVRANPACLVDVVLCVDNSGSIGNSDAEAGSGRNWNLILDYCQNLVDKLNVAENKTHMSVVDYDQTARVYFDLVAHKSAADTKAAIAALPYRGYTTNTTGGLYRARTVLTNPLYGPRDGVPKVIILITDGDPNVDADLLPAEVEAVKGENIRLVVVAVGNVLNEQAMQEMASTPQDYVHADDFESLDVIKESTINEDTCNPVSNVTGTPGAVYTRWGRPVCPSHAKLVYSGYVGGSHYTQVGNGHEYLCMPQKPQWGKTVDGDQGWTGYIYGAEYEMASWYQPNNMPFSLENNAQSTLHDHDVPCAVCVNPSSHATLMIPAAMNCIREDWTLEFTGYLVSEDRGHYGREYLCMDGAPQGLTGGNANKDGALFYPVQARCGSLPCPKYVEGWELTCSVCTK